MSTNQSTSPPLARLAVRVGVTGHRPNGLVDADEKLLRTRIREVLERIRTTAEAALDKAGSAYRSGSTIVRVISPLAEGADRLVAQEGVAMNLDLQCPLPFERDEYERDFKTAESRAEYRELLAKATAVLELDGARETAMREKESYEAVGRMVLKQCDILIAIWDGRRAEDKGGTGQIVDEALLMETPTLWIRSRAPHRACLLGREGDGRILELALDHLPKRVEQMLLPPSPSHTDLRKKYFAETQPSSPFGIVFTLFSNLITLNWKALRPRLRLENLEQAAREWHHVWQATPEFPPSVVAQVDARFRTHYAWADKLADYYANLYRSSFVLTYLMGGLAVFFALLGYALGWSDEHHPYHRYERVWIFSELVLILFILFIIKLGGRRRWHERWMDYRLLAEQLRQMRFLMPLGRITPSFRVPVYYARGDPRNTWVNWHFRAIIREAGIVNARIDAAYLNAYRDLLSKQEIQSQVLYHQENAERSHRLYHRLHGAGTGLFYSTLFVSVYHLLFHAAGTWATVLSAVFPAFGAAATGIRGQAEFQRIAERSHAMSQRLEEVAGEAMDPNRALSSKRLGQIAEAAAEIMTAEILDWRMVFLNKPLMFPS